MTQATLTTNANTTLLATTLTLNPGQNSLSNFVQNGGKVQVNGTVQLSNSAGGSTLTINDGTFIAGGGGQYQRFRPASIQMGCKPWATGRSPAADSPLRVQRPERKWRARMSILNQLSMGLFFNEPGTVNQNGGTIQFIDGSLNPGGTGGWISRQQQQCEFRKVHLEPEWRRFGHEPGQDLPYRRCKSC